MNNPRNNLTTAERNRQHLEAIYTLRCDLIDAAGRRSTFWFREKPDREDFARLWNELYTKYGHTTRAECV